MAEEEASENGLMRLNWLNWFLASDNRMSAVLIPLWGLAITAVYAQAIYQRAYLTLFDYGLVVVICALAGAITIDLARALLNYLVAMVLGIIVLFVLVLFPASTGTLPSPGDIVFSSLWTTVIFTAVFPFPFIGNLLASIVGAALGEKYL